MKLHELLDPALLAEMLATGYVKKQSHPFVDGLVIYNYTHAAQYDRVWNDVTKQCRGLIVLDGEVIARPFPKFFNYGEHEQAVKYERGAYRKVYPASDTHHALDHNAPVTVTDKLDGSLGILHRVGVGNLRGIATRGSFTSDQAIVATDLLNTKYRDDFEPTDGMTYLFEIIYPENRIVVDYGTKRDLILLAVLDTETGHEMMDNAWKGPRAARMTFRTLGEALTAEPRENVEGMVVTYADGTRVKIKQDDYVELHRLITGLNERVVWEWLNPANPRLITEKAKLPEEFWPWVEDVSVKLDAKARLIRNTAQEMFDAVPPFVERRDFAMWVKKNVPSRYLPLMFLLLDGRDVRVPIWKTLRPKNPLSLVAHSEDVA